MQDDLMAQGMELMLYGMGTVVVFLVLLVAATNVMSTVINRYFPQVEPPPVPPRQRRSAATPAPSPDPAVVAAISAAIHRHRHSGQQDIARL